MVTLSRLFIHPVKSMRGMGLTHAFADISGLAFDRLFMVTETDGTFITARQFPQMVKFIPAPLHDGLHLTCLLYTSLRKRCGSVRGSKRAARVTKAAFAP